MSYRIAFIHLVLTPSICSLKEVTMALTWLWTPLASPRDSARVLHQVGAQQHFGESALEALRPRATRTSVTVGLPLHKA